MDLPIVGKIYTWQEILAVAEFYELQDVVSILNTDPPSKPFKSDG
jgi:hypothetical protein